MITTGGPDVGPFSQKFEVNECVKKGLFAYKSDTKLCGCMDPSFVKRQWKAAVTNGNKLASRLEEGDWCLFESPNDSEDDFWLGRTVISTDLNGDCKLLMKRRTHIGPDRFDKGDYRVCIR